MSAQVTITQLPSAGAITGAESVPIVQNGVTVQTTTGAISASPSQPYTYLTVSQTPQLANSRYLGATNGLTITDGGAQGVLNITTTGALSSLVASGTGFQVKTSSTAITGRSIAVSGVGLSIANGSGVSGDPTITLTGQVLNLANLSANGLMTITTAGALSSTQIAAVGNQTVVTNADGIAGSPTIGLADNPIIPGTGAIQIPAGTTGQRPSGVDGKIRYNSTDGAYEGYAVGAWRQFSLTGFVATVTGTANEITATGTMNVVLSLPAALTFTGKTVTGGTFNITTLSVTGNVTLGDASADTVTINGTVQPGVVISGSSAGDALRITQTGLGNALVVEDSTNPDASPFVIDANGQVVQGYTTAVNNWNGAPDSIASHTTASNARPSVGLFNWSSNTTRSGSFNLYKSVSNTIGTQGIVGNLQQLGRITFSGDDGVTFIRGAEIDAFVDGTPGLNDMPGGLRFLTTADGASSPTERVRITSAGKTGFATAAPAATVHVAGDTILSNVNVLGASYDSVSFSVATEELTPTDLFFSRDGLKMYVIGSTGDDVNEYNLSTAWVVSSAVYSTVFSVASQDLTPQGLFFRADGTKMYVLGATNDTVFQYTLSTPWSVATASYDSISFSVAVQETTPTGIFFKPNGLTMYVVGNANDAVYQYTLSTAWNVSTATFLQSFSISGQEVTSVGMSFTGDGSRMFITGSTGDDVNVYNLTTPWDISTSAFVNVFSVAGQDTAPSGIYIKPDGTKMYIVGSTNDAVFQYTVPSIDIQLTGPTSVAALDVQQDLTVYGNTTVVGATTLTSTVGIGTTSPSASAILDAQSTTQGVRMPNMTTVQKNAIVSPAAGLMVFDTTLAKLSVYTGVAWQTITST